MDPRNQFLCFFRSTNTPTFLPRGAARSDMNEEDCNSETDRSKVWEDNPPTKQIYLDCEYHQMWGNNRHRHRQQHNRQH
jgi:hypothetical protein